MLFEARQNFKRDEVTVNTVNTVNTVIDKNSNSNRQKLFQYLERILGEDELHLLSILTRNPKIQVRVNGTLGERFATLIGIMQGDVLSAILFIFYLSCCLGKETQSYLNKLLIAPKYADDITYASNNQKVINNIKDKIPNKLKTFNLTINETKTEMYQIPKPRPPPPPPPSLKTLLLHKDDKPRWSELDWLVNKNLPLPKDTTPDWKGCKLLGSLLDTKSDIKRRKILTIDAMKKLETVFRSHRISIKLKVRCFQAYISSVFLYNSELWCINKSINEEINAFHRKQLRYAIGVRYPKIVKSKDLYEITKVEEWSKTIKRRRLNWLGHVMRLPVETPARLALNEHLRSVQNKQGRPKTTWVKTIKKDLEVANININLKNRLETINTLEEITRQRQEWRKLTKILMQ